LTDTKDEFCGQSQRRIFADEWRLRAVRLTKSRASPAKPRPRADLHDRTSGGSTPKVVYALLAENPALRNSLPWDKMRVFFGTSGMSVRAMPTAIFRWQRTPCSRRCRCSRSRFIDQGRISGYRASAVEYEATIQREFGLKDGEFPRFDLVLLGMGSEGTRSRFFPVPKHCTRRSAS